MGKSSLIGSKACPSALLGRIGAFEGFFLIVLGILCGSARGRRRRYGFGCGRVSTIGAVLWTAAVAAANAASK